MWEIGAREDVVFDQVYGESIFMRKSERRRRINPMFNRICLVDMTIFHFYSECVVINLLTNWLAGFRPIQTYILWL